MKRTIGISLALALILGLTLVATMPVAAATPIYVDAARPDDTGDGTSWATAKKTIQAGINVVDVGGTVMVAAGTYDAQVTISKTLTLQGAGEDLTFIKATGLTPVVTVSANDVTIQDLEITDDTQLVEGIRIISGASTGLTVDHVDLTEIGAGTGANAYGIYVNNSFADLSVTNSDFVPVTHTTYHRTMGIFAPNHLNLSDFEVIDSTFLKIWTGIYLRSAIDGLDVIGNAFGQVDSWDFAACVAGVYIGDGDDNNFDIENVVVRNNTFTDYGRGVYVWNYAVGEVIHDFEIYENTFTDSVWSSGIRFIGGLGYNEGVSFDGIDVHDNTFTQGFDVGAHVALIDFRAYCILAGCDVTVGNNDIAFSGGPYAAPWSGIQLLAWDGPFKNTVVHGNTLDGGGCGGGGDPPSSGVLIRHDANTYWPSDTLEMDILCNDITGFDNGVSIYDITQLKYGRLPAGSDVNINRNSIHGNTLYGVRNGVSTLGEMVDAEDNWWGDADGSGPYDPSGESSETTDVPPCSVSVDAMMNPDGTGDQVQGRVDYCPWVDNSVTTSTATGTASFATSEGNVLGLTAVAPPATPPVALPHGMFNFTICCLTGPTATLGMTFPQPIPVGYKWWKYVGGSWYSLPIGSDDGDNYITVTLRDNVLPDDEDTVPGQITDQGGPGEPGAVGWGTYPISRTRILLPWIALLAAIMAGASLLVIRRRRAQS